MWSCVPRVEVPSYFGGSRLFWAALNSLPKKQYNALLTELPESYVLLHCCHGFSTGHPKNPTISILTLWGRKADSSLSLLGFVGTAVHFPLTSSALVEVNKCCCQTPAKQSTATLQVSKHIPSPLNPKAQACGRQGWIYIPRRQWYSHLLLKQVEKRSHIKGLTFSSDCTWIHILQSQPSNKENIQLCWT